MQNKLLIAGAVLAALIGAGVFMMNQRKASDAGEGESNEVSAPEFDRDAITRLAITRPATDEREAQEIILEKGESGWRLTAPLEAEVDPDTVDRALDRLAEFNITGIAARNPDNFERLEVDDAQAVRVEVGAGSETVATLFLGVYRSRNTMVRIDDGEQVLTAEGSIKHVFDKGVDDWRNKKIVAHSAADIRAIRFELPAEEAAEGEEPTGPTRFAFERNAEDEWVPVAGQAEIENFSASKVQSIVSSVAGMRAVGFGDFVSEASPGPVVATVTLTVQESVEGDEEGEEPQQAPAETLTLRLYGRPDGADESYLAKEGDNNGYLVSAYIAGRLTVNTESFQQSEDDTPAAPPGGMPQGMPQLGGPGGGQIPPEILQQLQQQMGMAPN